MTRARRQNDDEIVRPHSALKWATPAKFARRCGLQAAKVMSKDHSVVPSCNQRRHGSSFSPSSLKKALCLSLAAVIASSMSTSSRWVASRSISASPTAVLM